MSLREHRLSDNYQIIIATSCIQLKGTNAYIWAFSHDTERVDASADLAYPSNLDYSTKICYNCWIVIVFYYPVTVLHSLRSSLGRK